MKQRGGRASKERPPNERPRGWPQVATLLVSSALFAGVTWSTGSAQDGGMALASVVAAVRLLGGRQGEMPAS